MQRGGVGSVTHTERNKKTPEKRLFACGLAYCQVSNSFVKTSENEGRFFRRSSQPEKPPEAESISGILAAAAAVVSCKGFSTNTMQALEKWT